MIPKLTRPPGQQSLTPATLICPETIQIYLKIQNRNPSPVCCGERVGVPHQQRRRERGGQVQLRSGRSSFNGMRP